MRSTPRQARSTPRRGGRLLLLLGAVGSLASCGLGGEADLRPDQNTLVFATDREPTCLDANLVGDMPQIFLARQYLDSVVSMTADGTIVPWLATRWTVSPDRKSYSFQLRDDVHFADGAPFDAAALKANLDHIVDPATHAMTTIFLRDYQSTSVDSRYVATVHLSQPNESFLPLMAEGILGMESPRSFARSREENCSLPIGSGPFRVVRWDRQQQVVLTRNPDYHWGPANALHQGPARVQTLVWKFISEPSVRFAALQAGKVDVIDTVPAEYQFGARNDPRLQFLSADRPGNPTNGTLNIRRAPFNDALVRQAFVESADVPAALRSIFFGLYTQAKGPLSSTTPFHADDLGGFNRYDPADAVRLLERAGWTRVDRDGIRTKGGRRLVVHVPVKSSVDVYDRALWEQVQATAAKTGFDVQLENVSDNRYLERYQDWDYDVQLGYWNGNNPDILRMEFGSPAVGVPTSRQFHANGSGFDSRAFDRLIATARGTADPGKRFDLYHAAQRIIAANYLQVRTYPQTTRLGIVRGTHGVHFDSALNLCTLYDAWKS